MIFELLKNALKVKKKTYQDLADHLDVSELTIKRMFKEQDCKVSRLVAICQFLQIDFQELLDFEKRFKHYPTYLSEEVEQALADDKVAFGVFLLIISHLSYEDMRRVTGLAETQLYIVLRKLEKLGLITLQTNNQIIITTNLPIAWRRHGALAGALKHINLKYLNYCFEHHQEPEHHYYSTSRLMSTDSAETIKQKLDETYQLFQQLATQDQIFYPSDKLMPYKLQIANSTIPVGELFFDDVESYH